MYIPFKDYLLYNVILRINIQFTLYLNTNTIRSDFQSITWAYLHWGYPLIYFGSLKFLIKNWWNKNNTTFLFDIHSVSFYIYNIAGVFVNSESTLIGCIHIGTPEVSYNDLVNIPLLLSYLTCNTRRLC